MAKIIWSKEATQVFLGHIEYARLEFGESTAIRWMDERKQIERRLKLYPTSYPPEPLLRNMTKAYRSCHIMRRRFKIVFSYDEENDIVHILDIWDTKMNPKTLVLRIKG